MPLAYDPPGAKITRRLLEPPDRVPLAVLSRRWFHQRVELRIAGHGRLAEDPALPGKLRGAFGNELLRSASPAATAGQPCTWDPPCALDVLMREQGQITGRLAMPRPFVVAVNRHGEDLVAALTVFGFACDWMPAASEAITAALRNGFGWMTSRSGHESAAGPTIRQRRMLTAQAVAVPPDHGGAALEFQSPVWFRGGDGFPVDFPALVANLGNRVSAMARWQDSVVQEDWVGLKAVAAEVAMDSSDLRSIEWNRRSIRQGGRLIPMCGLVGRVYLEGRLEPFLSLLALGATCHCGSHTSLGLGRYNLTA